MMRQGSLFSPGSANREVPIQAKLLARREDPETSKRAARRKARRLTEGQQQAHAALIAYGPGTTHQIAWKATSLDEPTRICPYCGRSFHSPDGRLPKHHMPGRLRAFSDRPWCPGYDNTALPSSAHQDRAAAIHHELARRFPELERKGLARVQQDPSKPCRCKPNAKRCRCRDVVVDGSRVWEVVP